MFPAICYVTECGDYPDAGIVAGPLGEVDRINNLGESGFSCYGIRKLLQAYLDSHRCVACPVTFAEAEEVLEEDMRASEDPCLMTEDLDAIKQLTLKLALDIEAGRCPVRKSRYA